MNYQKKSNTSPGLENYKLLIRSLRTKRYEKNDIQAGDNNIGFPKMWRAIRVKSEAEPNNR